MVKAMGIVYKKVAAHRDESPNTAVVEMNYESEYVGSSGYSASVSVVIAYLVVADA